MAKDPQQSPSEQRNRPVDSAGFLDQTIEFWASIAQRQLTREDARQIRENLTGFFSLLQQWDAAKGPADKSDTIGSIDALERKRAA